MYQIKGLRLPGMDVQTSELSYLDWCGDALAIGLFVDDYEVVDELQSLNNRLNGMVKELINEVGFDGKEGSITATRLGSNSPIKKLILLGLGKHETFKLDGLRQAAALATKAAQKEKSKILGLSLPPWNSDIPLSTQSIAEGIWLSSHQDNRFKSDPGETKNVLEQVSLLGLTDQTSTLVRAQQIVSGVILARELVSAPANVVTPASMAETATTIAHTHGLELEILEQSDCESLGMGAFLGVAQASDLPPKFIHLTYNPPVTPRRKVAIIGKGLTFDCGGLNIKVAGGSIEMMKVDMAGAAATLGAAKVIGQIRPKDIQVHFISAVTENMISGRAIHPGDILTAANGKTIEVNNTDAEGRLTLADALIFAEKLGVDALLDLATLTGACVVALGDDIAGLWTTDERMADELKTAANLAGEKVWQMPMEEKYFEGLKSIVADMKNTGPRAAGSITAALFLKQFVKETPWAHLDIAGPVWTEKERGYHQPGATGYGVRTLVNWILAL